jgi:hypothetical protein
LLSPRFLSGLFFVVSWLSAFIIGGKNMKRFAPVAIFSILLVTMIQTIAYHLDWWKFKKPFLPWLKSLEVAFNFGPYLIGTIGIFSLTYRFGFRVYLLANVVLDSLFSYVLIPFLEKFGLIHLTKLSRSGLNVVMIAIAIIIYPFQKWQDGNIKKKRKLLKWL